MPDDTRYLHGAQRARLESELERISVALIKAEQARAADNQKHSAEIQATRREVERVTTEMRVIDTRIAGMEKIVEKVQPLVTLAVWIKPLVGIIVTLTVAAAVAFFTLRAQVESSIARMSELMQLQDHLQTTVHTLNNNVIRLSTTLDEWRRSEERTGKETERRIDALESRKRR
jgi:uncharacterized protein YlxW (UPF0749 family)